MKLYLNSAFFTSAFAKSSHILNEKVSANIEISREKYSKSTIIRKDPALLCRIFKKIFSPY